MGDGERTTSYLVIRLHDQPEWAVVWDTLDIAVGRLDSQDIVIDDLEVSRKHCLFRRDGESFIVQDLGTGLGTLVNGEPVAKHQLAHGDVVQIGKLEVRFGQTTQQVRGGGNVCFASQLKKMGLPAAGPSAAGRTMLAFDPEDSLLFAPPTVPPVDQGVRAVSADGSLEELDHMDPLGLSIDGSDPGLMTPVRDLDRELAEKPDDWAVAAAGRTPLQPRSTAGSSSGSSLEKAGDLGIDGDLTAELRLVIAGPVTEVAAFVSTVRDRLIRFGSLRLEIRGREG